MARLPPLLISLLIFSGCVHRAPVVPPIGLLFTSYRAPLVTDFDETPLGTKHGEAVVMFVAEPFLGTSVAWGEADIETAAEEGGITTVHYADYDALIVLGFFRRFTVRVYGE